MTTPNEQVTTPATSSSPSDQPPSEDKAIPPRLSLLAVLSLLFALAAMPLDHLISNPPFPLPWSFDQNILIEVWLSPIPAVVLGVVALVQIMFSRRKVKGGWLAGLGVALAICSAIILLGSSAKPKGLRVRDDARTAVTQSIAYANDRDAYPTSIKVLRDVGYANIKDADPWGREWVLSPALTKGGAPKEGEDVYVYSKGPCRTGTYTPGRKDTGKCGAVGYSGLHGEFQGSEY